MARGFTLIYALVAMLAVGCASGGDRDGSGGGQQQPAGGTGPAVGGFGGAGGAGGTGPTGGAGGSGGTGGGRGGTGGHADSDGWCAVEAILEQRCSECHGSAPAFGAPMSLVTHDDLTAESPNGGGRPAYEVALARLAGEETPQMPPPSNPQLTEDELATFQAWVEAGAPEANDCDVGTGGTGDSGGPPSVDEVPWPYSCEPDEGEPMQFLAHDNPTPGDTTPFDASHVGGAATGNDPNLYQCFHFKAPWADGKQGLGFKPVIDNSRILHHWLLYASDNAPPGMTDGGMVSDCQLQGDENRTLLAGWAPGTPGQNMPPDVGMELPAGDRGFITLEVHYYNTSPGEPANDRSGVELCIANENRPHTAAQHWLGTENINVPPNAAATASDTCTPMLAGDETSTIISVTPHMHKIGTHAKLELLNPDGTTKKVLHDAPFDFEYQTTYTFPEPVTMHAGEKLKATCEYKNTGNAIVNFGEGSDEEMCYLFTTAYPAGSLHNGRNGCFFEFCVPGGIHRCIDNENILTALGGL